MTSKKVLENIRKRYVNSHTFQTWCDIILQDLERLEKLKNLIPLIEEKIENAKNDLRISVDNEYCELLGEIGAYTDILLILKEVLSDD